MISFGSAPGNLFNALGKIGLVLKQQQSNQSSQKTNFIDGTNGLIAQLVSEPDLQGIVGNGYIGALNGGTPLPLLQRVAQAVVDRVVYRDNPRFGQTLQNQQVTASIVEVIRQMNVMGASILAMTIGSTVSSAPGGGTGAFTGVGNGTINVSATRPFDGKVLENTYGETVLFTCVSDSYSGAVAAGSEGFSAQGAGATAIGNFDWPTGSNLSKQLTAINGNANVSGGNVQNNSGWDTWASSVPSNWTLGVGTAGTTIVQENSIVYDGASAIRLVGDGTTGFTLTQQYNASGGTSYKLVPLTQYSGCLWARRDSVAAGAGVLTIDWIDQNNTVIQDANGANNSITIDLTALTTVYTPYKFAFRTPEILPASQFLRFRLTTGLTSGRAVYLDKLGVGLMTQLAVNEPFAAVHAGSVPFEAGDYGTVAFTNSRGAGKTLSTFQTLLYQLLPQVAQFEVLFPSSSVPTISDALIG